mmetsp:Transcript_16654/g.19268  ORF Transcript_16654/g.19268 Transcript_16654/m.19268 type:complete len:89 (+) Transcript_16654:6-272(+)
MAEGGRSLSCRLSRYFKTRRQPSSSLQTKLDFYITPYNTCLDYKASMEFEDEQEQARRKRIANKDLSQHWNLMADFVLNLEKDVFRRS